MSMDYTTDSKEKQKRNREEKEWSNEEEIEDGERRRD